MKKLLLHLILLNLACISTINAAEQLIVQKGKEFQPSEVSIKVGDTLVFKNEDDVTHNVISTSPGNEFEITKMDPGAEEKVVMKTAGEIKIKCAIHPKMKLAVKIE